MTNEYAKLSVRKLPLSRLKPHPKNPRKHPEPGTPAWETLKRSLQNDYFDPIIVNERNGHFLVSGHLRTKVLAEMGVKYADCVVVDYDEPTHEARMIAANNQIGEWDDVSLAAMLKQCDDIALASMTDDQFRDLLGETEPEKTVDAEPQIDRAEELRKQWGVERGQIWTLGNHRLMCGDSTNAEDVGKLMGGQTANLCFTSPPYGQQRDYTEATKSKISDWDGLMRGVFGVIPMSESAQVLVNLGLIHKDGEWIPYWDSWIGWMRKQGWRSFGWYVWDQMNGLPGDWAGRLAPSHEFIFHFNRQGLKPEKWIACDPRNVDVGKRATAKRAAGGSITSMRSKEGIVKEVTSTRRNAEKIPDSVVRISRCATIDMARNHHPATFPIQFAEFFVKSWPGVVYEPFSGAGTTLVAAEQLDRRCFAMEIDPGYVAVTLQRFTDATGKTPTLT